MVLVAMLCEHCAVEIPYHRGRTIRICTRCRLEHHTSPQKNCEVCRRLDEDNDYGEESLDETIHP